jgi:hypothetical protein
MTNELHATLQLAECDGHQSISITSCFCGPINGPTVYVLVFQMFHYNIKPRADVQAKPGFTEWIPREGDSTSTGHKFSAFHGNQRLTTIFTEPTTGPSFELLESIPHRHVV